LNSGFGELLLEVGCEEIPAKYLNQLIAGFLEKILELLGDNRISYDRDHFKCYFTPRRLVVTLDSVAMRQDDTTEKIIGPPKKVAYDGQGVPTQAARSFAERYGVAVQNLEITSTPKGDYLSIKQSKKGIETRQVLEAGLASAVLSIPLPRAMYWSSPSGLHFIRPIRWLCCVFAGKLLKFRVGDLNSGQFTFGHRILRPGKTKVRGISEYLASLRQSRVILNPDERRQRIEEKYKELASGESANILEDEELLETHVALSEYPTPLLGSFDSAYLKLPQEILVTVMRDHQKYFSLIDSRTKKLLPRFIAVIDQDSDPKGYIRLSHERVLRARFADAEFFWESDLKVKLEDRQTMLEKVVYQEKLGTYAEKVQRIQTLAEWIVARAGLKTDEALLRRTARLCKCDLTTQMVKEFPELQGTMGGLYAEAQGEPREVSQAIYDHYKPQTLESEIPRSELGAVISIADKLDTIAGSFSLGERPSGSKDPFGLRRLAYGIIKVILEHNFSINWCECVRKAVDQFKGSGEELVVVYFGLLPFFVDHIKSVLTKTTPVKGDEISAVMATNPINLLELRSRLLALNEIRKRENFDSLATSFKRIKNIIRKSGVEFGGDEVKVILELLEQQEERDLYETLDRLRKDLASLQERRDYKTMLEMIAAMRPVVDRFFDKVLVNAEDEALRQNRFNLLLSLYRVFVQIADFSELQSANEITS